MGKIRYRNAVFIVTYAKQKDKIHYIILKRRLHWKGWEFPKGGIDSPETKQHAVKREIREETGLKILKMKKFDVSGKYKYKKTYPDRKGITGQRFSLYAVKVNKGKIKIDKLEHSGSAWVSFEQAMKRLTWPNQRKCLKIVDNWLKRLK
jgi:bis(5'-nucleosidyl)-tetraphosphatase